jgi:hypothetical protein
MVSPTILPTWRPGDLATHLAAVQGRDKKATTVWIIDDAAEVPG